MKTLFLVLFTAAGLFAQQAEVIFKIYAPALKQGQTVFITGSIDELGGWNPADVPMDYTGENIWQIKIKINIPQAIEYKFTLGSWEQEAADSGGLPFRNFNVTITGDTILKHTIFNWTTGQQRIVKGQITGTVMYHRDIKAGGLPSRDIIVWLPPGYEKSGDRYPVLYMHDGQNIIDPATSTFGVDWQMDEAADSMIRTGVIPPMIIVGIYNTSARSKEYLPGAKAEEYMNMIIKYFKPLIDSQYRTKPERENTFTGGSSAGGTISFMMVWEHPEVFSKALCFSPAFKTSSIDYITPVKDSEKRENVFFYIYIGGKGIDIRLQQGVNEMLQALKEKGYLEGKDFIYAQDPQAEHFEADWARHVPDALKSLFINK